MADLEIETHYSSNNAPTSDCKIADHEAIDPESGVKRGLKTRHLSMMALAGIIGPGLLIGTGGALAAGGPASLLIGFGVVGIVAFSVVQSVGELSTLYPTGGFFIRHADRMVDKAFGVAVGYNYFIIWFAVLANEYNLTCSVLEFWTDKIPLWGWFLLLWSAFLSFQMLGVESFGEAEFWLALIKILGLVAYFIFSIVYAAGGVKGQDGAIGFKYWQVPGPFNGHGFRGVAVVFVFCSTWVVGVEAVAVASTEARNPATAVPLATRQVFWRIMFLYMGLAFFLGLTCPANADELVNGEGSALKSPLTIAIQNAGWSNSVHLVNAFIFITGLSAINSSIYIASRTLLYLAQDGKAPRFLGWTNSRGVPVYAILVTNIFGTLSMMNVSTGSTKAYSYIVNLSGVSTFLVWGSISFVHIRFRQAWKTQGRDPNDLPFRAMLYPWNAYFGLFANIFLALVQGWTTLSPFNSGSFVDAYILIPLFPIIFIGYKFAFKTRFWRSHEIDLDADRRGNRDVPSVEEYIEELEQMEETRVKGILRRIVDNF